MISVLIKAAERYSLDRKKIVRLVENYLRKKGRKEGEVSLVFVEPEEIRRLNRQYRQLDKPTTVLAFRQGQVYPGASWQRLILGDLVICPKEAQKSNLSIEFLIKHGLKNLLLEIPTTKNQRTGFGRDERRVG